ncbi:MAG: adenosylcobinamide-GDP ribazoletransferase [Magnetococcales bacterium]|nr:adenosylcobinamide-GDP ribazoletransferase [Magnetococcales bacterium]
MTPAGRAWRLALGLLTRLPTGGIPPPVTGVDLGRSVLFYPLVGLLVGSGVAGMAWVTQTSGDALCAALVLVTWVGLTGALHLDGLADWADAAVGGLGNRQRTLEIMKDPRSGPAAVTTLSLLLIVKFAALLDLLMHDSHDWWSLATIPVVARTLFVLLFLTTPYANPQGMAAEAVLHLPRSWATGVVVIVGVGVGVGNPFPLGILMSAVAGVVFLFLRRVFMRRIQGFTGDMAGAMCEITEAVLLVLLAWWTALPGPLP